MTDSVLGIAPNGDTHEVLKHGTTGREIEKIYVALAQDPEGGEGILGFQGKPNGPWLPLVASDRDKVERLADKHGKAVGELMNLTVVIAEFSVRTDVKIIHEHDPDKEMP